MPPPVSAVGPLGRPLRRYRRRWKVERLFAWLQNFRRIVVRYERVAENFLGHATPCQQPHSLAAFMRWPLLFSRQPSSLMLESILRAPSGPLLFGARFEMQAIAAQR